MHKIVSTSYLRKIVLINMLIIGLFLPDYCFAQTKKMTARPKEIFWYADFTLTIKGNGEKKNEDETSIIRWSIDRSYSFSFKFNSKSITGDPNKKEEISMKELVAVVKSGRFTRYTYSPVKPKDEMPMKIKIKDLLNVITIDEGEGKSFENTTVITSWETDKTVNTPNVMTLTTDNEKRTYNINFPIFFFDERMKMLSQTIIDRSDYGYDDKPTHEALPIDSADVLISKFRIPNVKGLISGFTIQHTPNDFLYPANFPTAWEYDSAKDFPDLQPDNPLIQDVPDSKTKVKIRVLYRFSKTPFY